jgi:hypothetical protein
MSQTFEMICKDCNKRQWIGQSHYIYTTEPEIIEFAEFLHTHVGHDLTFLETQDAADLERELNESRIDSKTR